MDFFWKIRIFGGAAFQDFFLVGSPGSSVVWPGNSFVCPGSTFVCPGSISVCPGSTSVCLGSTSVCPGSSSVGPQEGSTPSVPPTTLRAGACREGKGRVPLPLVAVDRRHREWLGRYRGEEPEFYTP